MPQIVISPRALDDLVRLRDFLREKSEAAAARAKRTLVVAIERLGKNPNLGRLVEDDLRLLTVSFGKNGYQIAYAFDHDSVYILAIKGCREESFRAV